MCDDRHSIGYISILKSFDQPLDWCMFVVGDDDESIKAAMSSLEATANTDRSRNSFMVADRAEVAHVDGELVSTSITKKHPRSLTHDTVVRKEE